jgi:hypothetical protein
MSTIITRIGKGSALTFVEADANFTNLNTGKVEKSGDTMTGALVATGLTSNTNGVGYATGAGGTVTQLTSKSTGVTLNKPCGAITMNNSTMTGLSVVSFVLTNSFIAATDVVVVGIKSGATVGAYGVAVSATAAGSCSISLHKQLIGSLSEAVVLNFAVIKAVAA